MYRICFMPDGELITATNIEFLEDCNEVHVRTFGTYDRIFLTDWDNYERMCKNLITSGYCVLDLDTEMTAKSKKYLVYRCN